MDDNTNTELSSMSEQLYDFLREYNLIQSDMSEEDIKELLEKALAHTNEDEEVITSFVSNYRSNDKEQSSAFLITKDNRIIITNQDGEPEFLEVTKIESLQNNPENESHLSINTSESPENLVLLANDEEGKNTLIDALYTAFSMVLPEDKLNTLFGEVSEKDEEPEQEVIEDTDNNTQDKDIIDVTPVDEEKPDKDKAKSAAGDNSSAGDKKPETNKKTLYYVIGGIAIVAVIVIAYFLFNGISQNTASSTEVSSLVDLFNRTDSIYFTARDYQQQGVANVTPEQWQELNSNINAIEEEYLEIERSSNEQVDSLYQSLNSYIQAVITATYYGQQASQNQTALYENSLNTNLDRANNERLLFLNDLQENFSDMMENIENQTDLSETQLVYPQSEETQRLIEEANSRGSSEGANNTRSSSEAVENSRHSKENQ